MNHKTQEPSDNILTSEQAAPFYKQQTKLQCSCGNSLEQMPIHCYPHSAGWKVKGFQKLQWLYIHCPNCKYDWALWKLGVQR